MWNFSNFRSVLQPPWISDLELVTGIALRTTRGLSKVYYERNDSLDSAVDAYRIGWRKGSVSFLKFYLNSYVRLSLIFLRVGAVDKATTSATLNI